MDYLQCDDMQLVRQVVNLCCQIIELTVSALIASVFALVAISQMAIWAAKKHRNYKREFGKDYPADRYVMIPFIF